MDTPLNEIDRRDARVRKALAEMLPRGARSKCPSSGIVPVELIEEMVGGNTVMTVGDLILELAVVLTDGHFTQEIEIDTSALELTAAAPDRENSERVRWAWLTFDLNRPDWTVVVNLQALEEVSDPQPGPEGVLCILVRAGLDFRGWLAEERTREMLQECYVQYQVAGTVIPGQNAETRYHPG